MAVVFDKLLRKTLMHDHLPLNGGELSGDVVFPSTGFVMKDSNNEEWRITVNDDGVLVTTLNSLTTNRLMTELGDYLLTESGDFLIQE
jgi:hypothetical protein